jgi:hypothetical protein
VHIYLAVGLGGMVGKAKLVPTNTCIKHPLQVHSSYQQAQGW